MYWNKAKNSCTYLVHGNYDREKVLDPLAGISLSQHRDYSRIVHFSVFLWSCNFKEILMSLKLCWLRDALNEVSAFLLNSSITHVHTHTAAWGWRSCNMLMKYNTSPCVLLVSYAFLIFCFVFFPQGAFCFGPVYFHSISGVNKRKKQLLFLSTFLEDKYISHLHCFLSVTFTNTKWDKILAAFLVFAVCHSLTLSLRGPNGHVFY